MPTEPIATQAQVTTTHTVQHDYVTQSGRLVREKVTEDGTLTAVMDLSMTKAGVLLQQRLCHRMTSHARQSPCCCHSLASLGSATGGGRLAPHLPCSILRTVRPLRRITIS